MTATNHMLAGAVVATGIQQPLLIVPLAVASHFVLDMLPHFGIHEDDQARRNNHPLFHFVLIIDVVMVVSLLALLPLILKGAISSWVLLLGMVMAWIPDAIWIPRFFRSRRGQEITHNWMTKFHEKIQWFERPPGLVIELFWFVAMGVALGVLAAA